MLRRILPFNRRRKIRRNTDSVPLDPVFASLEDYFQVIEVSPGPFVFGDSFRHKFRHEPPQVGHHLIGLYRKSWDHLVPVGYLNFNRHEAVYLVGGGLTDGRAFEHIDPGHAQAITDAGGVLYLMLRAGFNRFTPHCDAFFGHVGNPRALEVDLKAGFERTPHEHLVAYFPHPISADYKQRLIADINALGAF